MENVPAGEQPPVISGDKPPPVLPGEKPSDGSSKAALARQALEAPPQPDTPEPILEIPEVLRQKIEQVKQAMFKKFERYGAKADQFETIQVGSQLVVAYTGNKGLDLAKQLNPKREISYKDTLKRSWRAIHADPSDTRFVVKIDDEEFDTRDGMTYELQELLVAEGKIKIDASGRPQVWVTGKKPDNERSAPVTAEIIDGISIRRTGYQDSGSHLFRFRPVAIVFEDIEAYLLTI